ncbi:MAG: caspase family protein [Aridibacter sp.]
MWFTELKNYTTNITFIFDSCHSGTVTRGGNNKSVERELKTKNNSRGGSPQLTDGMTRNESYVTISGSLPQQESQEDLFPDPDTKKDQWDGALTYSLVHLLKENPDITYRELIKQVQDKVVSMNKGQTPQAEGDIDRLVFGTSATRGKTPIFIESSNKIKRTIDEKETELSEIKMKVGSIVGAGKGAAAAVFWKKPGEKIRKQIGSGVVTSSTEFESTAEIVLLDESLKEIPKDVTVNVVSPSFSNKNERLIALDYPEEAGSKSGGSTAVAPLVVSIFEYVRKNVNTKKIAKTVKSSKIFKTYFGSKGAESPEWDVAVIYGTYKEFKYGNYQPETASKPSSDADENTDGCTEDRIKNPPTDADKGFFIINRDGMPIYNLWFNEKNEKAGECISEALVKQARIENLRTLSSGESELSKNFNVEFIRVKSHELISRSPLKCTVEPVSEQQQKIDNSGTPQLKAGDMFYVKITNNTERNLYTYIYTLTTNGKIGLLFPPEGSAAGEKLQRGQSITTVQKLDPSGCAVFFIEPPDVSPPGLETIKIIATSKEFPGKMLEQDSIELKASRGGGDFNDILEQAVTGKTRSGTMKFEVSDWVTKEINLEIIR